MLPLRQQPSVLAMYLAASGPTPCELLCYQVTNIGSSVWLPKLQVGAGLAARAT